jgi:hypothetical protein
VNNDLKFVVKRMLMPRAYSSAAALFAALVLVLVIATRANYYAGQTTEACHIEVGLPMPIECTGVEVIDVEYYADEDVMRVALRGRSLRSRGGSHHHYPPPPSPAPPVE